VPYLRFTAPAWLYAGRPPRFRPILRRCGGGRLMAAGSVAAGTLVLDCIMAADDPGGHLCGGKGTV